MLNNMYLNYNGIMNLGNALANNKAVVYEEKAANVLNDKNVVNLRKANPVKVQKVEEEVVVAEEVEVKEEVVEEAVEVKEEAIAIEADEELINDIMNELKEEGVIDEEGKIIKVEEPKEEVKEVKNEEVVRAVEKLNEEANKEIDKLANKIANEPALKVNKEEPKKKVNNKKTFKDKAIDVAIVAADCAGKACIDAAVITGAATIAGAVIGGIGGGTLYAIKTRKLQPILNGLGAVVGTCKAMVEALSPFAVIGYGLQKVGQFMKKLFNR